MTTGTITVDLNNVRDSINSGTTLGEKVIGGVADQGDLIGMAIGLVIAIGLLFGVVFLVITIIKKIVGSIHGVGK